MSLLSKFNTLLKESGNEISSVVEQNAREFIRKCPSYFKNYKEWEVETFPVYEPTPRHFYVFHGVPIVCTLKKDYSKTSILSIICYVFADGIRIQYLDVPLGVNIESDFKISPVTTGIPEENYSIHLATRHVSHLISL